MDNPFIEFGQNRVVWTTVSAWLIAQTIKVVFGVTRDHKFNFKWFIGTGGMPSAHSAGAAALASSTGINYGFDSGLFAIAFLFALVTIVDAQGVRRAAGKQAEILNKMLEDSYQHTEGEKPDRLKELLGHTPKQVFIGALIGIVVSIIIGRE